MRNLKDYNMIIFGVMFWLIETAIFGFNMKPCCFAEEVCDKIAACIILFGIIRIFVLDTVRDEIKDLFRAKE